MRKIAVVTGTRAEYGLLYWIIKGIHDDTDLELQLIVTGMHLSPEFGLTYKEIEKDGFPIAERVEMLMSSDSEVGISTSIGLGVIGFAQALARLKPDILVLLGDRFETMAAATAAMVQKIPIAHIHGGESTEGAIDEPIRHAVTKMSHLHFPAAEVYAERIKQMGEEKWRVFNFGAPGLDNIKKLPLLSREKLEQELGQAIKDVVLITFHPITLDPTPPEEQINELLTALEEFPQDLIFTSPNADAGGRRILKAINEFVAIHPRASLFTSLGRLKYLSLLQYVKVMAGNSSSGIIEAPSFELPVVNIGTRQKNRLMADNVINVPCKASDIKAGIKKALDPQFRASLAGLINLYGSGEASPKIVNTLKECELGSKLLIKKFVSL